MAWKRLAVGVGALASAGLFALLFGRPVVETFTICWQNDDYSHGLILPFISAYLIWQLPPQRNSRASSESVPFSPMGLALLLCGLMLLFLGQISRLLFFRWLGFFPGLLGVLFLLFGSARMKPFIGPLLLNFMAKPLPDALLPRLFFPLQVLAARVSAWTLDLFQVPVYLRGNVIEIPGMKLNVEEACSGLRSLMALLTVAIIVLLTVEIPRFAKLAIVVLAVFVAIALNVVRVSATGVLAHFVDPQAATGFFHTFSGLIVFLIGLGILFSLGKLIEQMCVKEKAS